METEFLQGHAETTIRATKLSTEQIQLAEVAFIKLGEDWQRLLDCVDHWKRTGAKNLAKDSPRIDDAFKQFKAWLDDELTETSNGKCSLRDHSRKGLKLRVNIFANGIGNLRLNEITADTIENFLGKLDVSNVTKDNYKRAISRFFSWSIQRPRRWATVNPCREIRIVKGEKAPPAILTVNECKAILGEAERQGAAVHFALSLFAGLRPSEVDRTTWDLINLTDREIRVEAIGKTDRPRVVEICDTLLKWLKRYEGQEIHLPRRKFDAVKIAAGFKGRQTEANADLKPWPVDVMRHTAISHFFRQHGSYGKAAERFGNSEAIIKRHYQGRVSSDDTKKFYALKPAVKNSTT